MTINKEAERGLHRCLELQLQATTSLFSSYLLVHEQRNKRKTHPSPNRLLLAPLKIVAKNATIKASKKREIASKTTMSAHSVRHSTHGRHI